MGDGLRYQPPASTSQPTVDTDEVSRGGQTVHQQIVKFALGADGAHDTLVDSGQQTMANSVPVVISSDQSALPTTVAKPGTATGATAAMTQAASAAIKAANTNRLGLIIFNPLDVDLLINLGAAASSTAAVARIGPRQSYVLPILYTGVINGILAQSGGDGNVYVQELTA